MGRGFNVNENVSAIVGIVLVVILLIIIIAYYLGYIPYTERYLYKRVAASINTFPCYPTPANMSQSVVDFLKSMGYWVDKTVESESVDPDDDDFRNKVKSFWLGGEYTGRNWLGGKSRIKTKGVVNDYKKIIRRKNKKKVTTRIEINFPCRRLTARKLNFKNKSYLKNVNLILDMIDLTNKNQIELYTPTGVLILTANISNIKSGKTNSQLYRFGENPEISIDKDIPEIKDITGGIGYVMFRISNFGTNFNYKLPYRKKWSRPDPDKVGVWDVVEWEYVQIGTPLFIHILNNLQPVLDSCFIRFMEQLESFVDKTDCIPLLTPFLKWGVYMGSSNKALPLQLAHIAFNTKSTGREPGSLQTDNLNDDQFLRHFGIEQGGHIAVFIPYFVELFYVLSSVDFQNRAATIVLTGNLSADAMIAKISSAIGPSFQDNEVYYTILQSFFTKMMRCIILSTGQLYREDANYDFDGELNQLADLTQFSTGTQPDLLGREGGVADTGVQLTDTKVQLTKSGAVYDPNIHSQNNLANTFTDYPGENTFVNPVSGFNPTFTGYGELFSNMENFQDQNQTTTADRTKRNDYRIPEGITLTQQEVEFYNRGLDLGLCKPQKNAAGEIIEIPPKQCVANYEQYLREKRQEEAEKSVAARQEASKKMREEASKKVYTDTPLSERQVKNVEEMVKKLGGLYEKLLSGLSESGKAVLSTSTTANDYTKMLESIVGEEGTEEDMDAVLSALTANVNAAQAKLNQLALEEEECQSQGDNWVNGECLDRPTPTTVSPTPTTVSPTTGGSTQAPLSAEELCASEGDKWVNGECKDIPTTVVPTQAPLSAEELCISEGDRWTNGECYDEEQ